MDSTLATLDTRERAAQLVMPWMWGRYVPEGDEAWGRLRSWVEAGVGGIITSIGPPLALADKLNRLQRMASVPLLFSVDMEHGPGQRLSSGVLLPYGLDMGSGTEFPPAMAFGAAGETELAYELGRITAVEARAVGIHMDFAPVVDVNNNPANPIINVRSYGGDPDAVARLAVAQLKGLQDHGMLATAKHFPGHGDVEYDTHLVPLILRINAARADSVELVPYRAAIRAGVAGVMSAHIAFPALSGDSILPATLSPRMLDSLLVRELGFDGLVVTDALDMGAIVRRFGAGESAVLALVAGADILLQPVDPIVTVDAVVAAVQEGRITPARLERSVRKVLAAKARVGLHRRRTVDLDRIAQVVGAPEHRVVAARAAERSITLVRDHDGLVPLSSPWVAPVLMVSYTDHMSPFEGRTLARALRAAGVSVDHMTLGPDLPHRNLLDSLATRADRAALVIVAANARVRGDRSAALDSVSAAALRTVIAARPTIVVSLGSPYLLQELPEAGTYLLGWAAGDVSQTAVARALLGDAPITGTLPTAIPPFHSRGDGIRVEPSGLDPAALDSIGAVIRAAIDSGVTPGAVVAVGRSRGPAWVRALGRTDWAPGAPAVTDSTIYDLASLTKVVATTTAVMTLVDEGRIELDAPLSRYLPEWPIGGWRDEVTIRRLLTHTAGLSAFAPFWHPAQGALRGRDAILAAIVDREPDSTPGSRYVYSDLGAILLGAAAEEVAGAPLDAYLRAALFDRLGMDDTGFNPAAPLDRIAPTEVDTIFRHTHVHGVVHDENAFAMGGVAGHAGLFSTAPDLARFARMLLRAHRSGGDPAKEADAAGVGAVVSAGIIREFTRQQPGWDRGLGWDVRAGTRIAESFSPAAFGHTGFTGTSLWIDPGNDLYIVLLTNRVNPTRAGSGIGALREAVHELAVRAAGTGGGAR